MGFGVETSSHKYGLFQHICEQFEVALPGGRVETCSRTHNEDMFYSIPWSYGTIGFLLSAEIRFELLLSLLSFLFFRLLYSLLLELFLVRNIVE
jgi:hypothetical protein